MATNFPQRCTLCGGSGGGRRLAETGGAHYLCQALAKLGHPTASLGDECSVCEGSGRSRRGPIGGPGVFLPIDPTGREIELWAGPLCSTCGGRGILPPEK